MSNFVNKSKIDDTIREKSARTRIGSKAIPYIEDAVKRLVIGMIEADNKAVKPNSEATLRKKHLKRAMSQLDEKYGLEGILGLEAEPKTQEVNLERDGQKVDLHIRLNVNTGDGED